MRTKTLLLSAAVLAAGLAASTAQSVYSVNAVGYVNITITNGYNLICNPLNGTNNNINTIIPSAPGDSLVLRWRKSTQSFSDADTYFDTGNPATSGWVDSDFNPSTNVLNPGEAFFFKKPNPGTSTLTFVGEVPQGNLTNTIVTLYGFYSSIVPQSAGLTSLGFPGKSDMRYLDWNKVTQRYGDAITYLETGNPLTAGWYDSDFNKVEPTPGVGDGFVIFNPTLNGVTQWGRTFTVN